ncbi:hypothetical protein [Clostridium sp. BNL1100]|uniref:hypothetical protein n=1 Tax=Clostridium sp. BNL1100 TaxID=755731 RepID=UPI00024A7DDC|nr:hypothetical protein [Clostridium sp. BNL1100]AEY65803.1 hypothetical protein Clo1100_1583 [Clostridium sp. BNL1100]
MKNKKLFLSISYVVLLSLLIAGAILFSKPSNNSIIPQRNSLTEENLNNGILAYKSEINSKEDIKIVNNRQKLDLQASLIENMNGEVTIDISYKIEGKKVNKTIDTSKVPEIRNLLRFREKFKKGYRIDKILVNDKVEKLYFYVRGREDNRLTQTWLYTYNLKTSSTHKLFYDIGDFSDFNLSPDGKYNAFAYQNNLESQKHESIKNKVVIIRCEDDKIILNGDKDVNGKTIGQDSGLYIYKYDFIKWENPENCLLKQISEIKDGSSKVHEQNVYYNVVENKIKVK